MEYHYKITEHSTNISFTGHAVRPDIVKELFDNFGLSFKFELLGRYKPMFKIPDKTHQRAYSYTRFSTLEQQKGDSYRRQVEAANEYATKHGLVLDDALYVDRGISAYKGQNAATGALSAFLDNVVKDKVPVGSVLIIEHLDRLSRSQVFVALHLFSSIIEKGIDIYTTADSKLYTKENINDIGNLIYSIIMMVKAHDESDLKSKRVGAAWANKRDKGKTGHILTKQVPAWLRVSNNHIEPIPERVEIIKRIFDMTINGVGTDSIARQLNLDGIDTWGDGINQSRKADGWHPSYIKKIITNKSVYGVFTPHRMIGGVRVPQDEIADYYPIVVPR